MALLKDVKARIPSADTVAGRVIAHHEGKHVILGTYVGDGVVQLSKDGERLMTPVEEAKAAPSKKAPKNLAGLSPAMNSDLG